MSQINSVANIIAGSPAQLGESAANEAPNSEIESFKSVVQEQQQSSKTKSEKSGESGKDPDEIKGEEKAGEPAKVVKETGSGKESSPDKETGPVKEPALDAPIEYALSSEATVTGNPATLDVSPGQSSGVTSPEIKSPHILSESALIEGGETDIVVLDAESSELNYVVNPLAVEGNKTATTVAPNLSGTNQPTGQPVTTILPDSKPASSAPAASATNAAIVPAPTEKLQSAVDGVNNLSSDNKPEYKPLLQNGRVMPVNQDAFKLGLAVDTLQKSVDTLQPVLRETSEQSVLQSSTLLGSGSAIRLDSQFKTQMPVNISFGQPQWAGQVADRAAMMASQKIQFAELQLDPPELGQLQVKVSINNDQASVHFSSPHAGVREALDQSSVRLRELFEQQGLNLADVDVSDQQTDQQPSADTEDSHLSAAQENSQEEDSTQASSSVLTGVYGVDYYV